MIDHCITVFEVIGDSSTIQKMEDEYFTHQTWETWSENSEFWGLDFDKVVSTPHSLTLEWEPIQGVDYKNHQALAMLSELFYPTRKARPTVKKALTYLSVMPDLLPSEFAPPKNLYQVMALLRQTEIGRKLIFMVHLHYRNRKRYGEDAMRNWRTKHWGSSVPCKHFEVLAKGRYLLHTSYKSPLKVFQRLSEQLQVTIHVRHMDNRARWAGIYSWQGGVSVEETSINTEEFALEQFFGFKVKR